MATEAQRAVAEKVASELRRAHRTTAWLANHAGIPYTSLSRKLRSQANFTFPDLANIAEALGVSPSTLTPDACGVGAGRMAS